MLTELQKANWKFKLVGLFKIRMIGFVGARLVSYSEKETVIKIPLTWRTRNHLGSMYFGALATGADVAGAWIAFDYLDKTRTQVSIVFKDQQSEFFKRADGDVFFTCKEGQKIAGAFEETVRDGERKNIQLDVIATVPEKYKEEPVAKFTMTLSMKAKK